MWSLGQICVFFQVVSMTRAMGIIWKAEGSWWGWLETWPSDHNLVPIDTRQTFREGENPSLLSLSSALLF